MNFNKIVIPLIILSIILLGMFFICRVTVGAGEEDVLVSQPLFIGSGGVENTPLKTGSHFVWLTTEVIPVSIVPTSQTISFDDFSSKDNILLDFETTFQYQITDPVSLIKNFGKDWFKNDIMSQYPAVVRDVVKTVTMSQLMSDSKTALEIDHEVKSEVTALIKKEGLPIQILNISLGRAKPSAAVQKQINATAAAQQSQKTIDAQTIAQNKRVAEEKARADADQAYRKEMGMSAKEFVSLQEATLYSKACEDSKMCIVMPSGSSGNIILPKVSD